MVRLAVIGSNFVTDWLIDALRETPVFELAAVCSRTLERGQEYAARHGAPKVIVGLDDLCRDPDIDAVYVATPNLFHAPQTIALLESGKHVLCEKPVATDCASFDAMCDAARKHNRVLMEAMVCAHLPCWLEIHKLLDEIGPVRRASITFCQYSSRYDKFKAGIVENAFDPTLGNGALMDLGVYCVHAAQMIFGAPKSVRAAAVKIPGSIDGAGSILLGYDDCIADIQYSKISQGAQLTEIQGEGGSLLIDSITRPTTWRLIPRTGKRADGLSGVSGSGLSERSIDVLAPRHAMAYELSDFLRQIHGESMPQFNENTRAVMQVLDEARAQTGVDFKKGSV